MSHSKILALQTGVPDHCFSQDEVSDFYVHLLSETSQRRQRAVRSIMNYSGVECRYSAIEPDFFNSLKTTQQRNDRYMTEAMPLAERVISEGLETAGISPDSINHFIVVSCTGFNTPGLDLLLARRFAMSTHLSRTQILGMGCYGAFPGIKRAMDSINSGPDQLALVLTLELCTLHLQFEDSAEAAISTSLFADGAGMVVIGAQDTYLTGPTLLDTETYCDYQTLDHMSFQLSDHGFRMYLSSYVADVLAANIRAFVERLLDRHALHCEDIKFWVIHPGSKRIVEYIQQQLQLSDDQIRFSLETLRDFGNMSSATILFVLNHIMQSGEPHPGDYGVMMAFGPGLTMEALLIRW